MTNKISKKMIIPIALIYCLIPLALISGSFLPDLFLSLVGVIFLTYSIKYKLWNNYSHNYNCNFIIVIILSNNYDHCK